MAQKQAVCALCGASKGDTHALTGRKVKTLVTNEEKTALVCADCVLRCVEIIFLGEKAS
jgi:NAD-dependent dihydropyrimidine dehydrogenase PreA subunit